MELHFIETGKDYYGDPAYEGANPDALTAMLMAGCKSNERLDYYQMQHQIIPACNEWNFKVYVRKEGESLSAAKLLNSRFDYVKPKSAAVEVSKFSLSKG